MSPLFNNKKSFLEEEPALTGQNPQEASAMQTEAEDAEVEEIVIPVPPVAEPFHGLDNKVAYFGFSQRGQSHILSGMPCQDRCCHVAIPEKGILVTAVADGVGSCALSDLGAHTAVYSSVEYIRDKLQTAECGKLNSAFAGTLLRNAMQHAYDQVELTAEKHEQLLYSLQSTLTIALYDGVNLYFGHAGDDGIVALTEQRTLAMATTRHKGEESSSVYPLQGKNTWQFGMVPDTVAFVMATDGVLDAFVGSSFQKDRVYYPFVEPIFTAEYTTKDSVRQACEELYAYMSGKSYRATVTDDLSFIAVMNLEKLPRCLPEFDLDAWNEETRQHQERVREVLYSRKEEPSGECKDDLKQDTPSAAGPDDQDWEQNGKPETAPEIPAEPRNPRPAQPGSRPRRAVEPDTKAYGGRKSADRNTTHAYISMEDESGEDVNFSPQGEYRNRKPRASSPEAPWDEWPPRTPNRRRKEKSDGKGRTPKHRNVYSEMFWSGFLMGLAVAALIHLGFKVLKLLMTFSWLVI